ncbi:hypothetical protein GCM10027296_14100 [Chitinimonas naiadis]
MPWLANLPLWSKVGLSLALCGLLGHYLRHAERAEIRQLRLLPDGRWWLSEGETGREYAQESGIYCTPWLTVLPLRSEDAQFVRLRLWPDSASRDDLRRLRVWLRWGTGSEEQGGPLAAP